MEGTRTHCSRVRQLAALAPDGTLSEVERGRLERHTAICADCREFAADVASLTFALREAPLQELSRPAPVVRPLARQPRRLPRLSFRTLAAVTTAAASIVVSLSVTSLVVPGATGQEKPPEPRLVLIVASNPDGGRQLADAAAGAKKAAYRGLALEAQRQEIAAVTGPGMIAG